MIIQKLLPCVLLSVMTVSYAAPAAPGGNARKLIKPDMHADVAHRPVIIDNPVVAKAPVIQIVKPNAQGISHNQYHKFSTDQRGVIFSNNTARVNNPINTAEHPIDANPLLQGQAAKIIINEITGKHPSRLQGHMSIAGQAADLIISNPNGIELNGVTVSNSPYVVLTTGKPVLEENSHAYFYDVSQGNITIKNKGANFANVDRVDLLARSLTLNNKLWVKHSVNVVTGTYAASTHNQLHIIPKSAKTTAPKFAIDMANMGGMFAEKIHLVGTEKGIGVNSPNGQLSLAEKGFILDLEKQLAIDKGHSKRAKLSANTNAILLGTNNVFELNNTTDRFLLKSADWKGKFIDFIYPQNPVYGGRIFVDKDNPKKIVFGSDPIRFPHKSTIDFVEQNQTMLNAPFNDVFPTILTAGSFSPYGDALPNTITGTLGPISTSSHYFVPRL